MKARFLNYIGWLLFILPTQAASANNKDIIPPHTLFTYSKEELQKLMTESVGKGIEISHDHLELDTQEERETGDFLKDNPNVNLDSITFQLKALEIKKRIEKKKKSRAKQSIQVLFDNFIKPQLDEKKDLK